MTLPKIISGVLLITVFSLSSCGKIDVRNNCLNKNLSYVFTSVNQDKPNLIISFVNQSEMLRLLDITILCDDEMILSACSDSLGNSTEVTAQLNGKGKHEITLISTNFSREKFTFQVPEFTPDKMFVKINFIMTSGHTFQEPGSWSVRIDEEDRAFF